MLMTGPLAPLGTAMAEQLVALGYTRRTATEHMRLVGKLSRFMQQRGLEVSDLSLDVVEQFLGTVRATSSSRPTARTLSWLLDYLTEIGMVPARVAPPPASWDAELLERYRHYLLVERGLAEQTVALYLPAARLLLTEQPGGDFNNLSAGDVSRFMTRHCGRLSLRSAERLATGLRSFLGFALLDGLVAVPLASAVPSVARWSVASLPKGLARGEVQALLASCDRERAIGRRDYAILVLLTRLGLRAAEVATLCLDDIDWRNGEIVVRGKGRTQEALPLPCDVGAAIVAYLQRGRPRRREREVFMRSYAPLRGLSPEGVSEVVRSASERAGLGSFGSHRLRHTAGTEMLRAGASLSDVAQVLRHRSITTTAIYAKVDHRALRELAMAWPKDER